MAACIFGLCERDFNAHLDPRWRYWPEKYYGRRSRRTALVMTDGRDFYGNGLQNCILLGGRADPTTRPDAVALLAVVRAELEAWMGRVTEEERDKPLLPHLLPVTTS